jgi:hypothetical protein
MKKQAKIEPAAHSKKVVTAMRKQMLSDSGAVLTHGVERDEHGDTVAFCDYRATCRARMIAADYALILAVDGERGCLDGLRVGTFEGLAIGPQHGAGDVYAVFTNGRKVPFLREERTPVTEPNERAARELEYARLHKVEATVKRAAKLSRSQIEARRDGGKARAVLSNDVQKRICELYAKMWKTRTHSWRYGEAARLAASEKLTRIDGDPITKRNVSDCIARLKT